MLRWLKEFWKDCPWYGFLFLGLSACVLAYTGTNRNNLVGVPVAAPAWVALVYLSKRWELLGNRVFHLLAGLASVLAVAVCMLALSQGFSRALAPGGDAWDSVHICLMAATGVLAALSLLALTPLRRELRPPAHAARLGACAFLAAVASFGLLLYSWLLAMLYIHTVVPGRHL